MRRIVVSLLVVLQVCFAGQSLAADNEPAPAVQAAAAYRLGPDDRLRIGVYGEDALSGEYHVGSDGQISFPLAGMVKAGGLTVAELQQALTASLAKSYLQDPKVSVDVIEYRPFYILGEVSKPGQYPYRTGMTVMSAVATAGGYTYRANRKRVFVKHADQGDEREYRLSANTPVSPGDTIRIGERYF